MPITPAGMTAIARMNYLGVDTWYSKIVYRKFYSRIVHPCGNNEGYSRKPTLVGGNLKLTDKM